MNKPVEEGLVPYAAAEAGVKPQPNFLAREVAASFARQFIETARMDASLDQKVELFQARTRLAQHFLGLQAGEEHGQPYGEAALTVRHALKDAICDAIATSGEVNAAQMAEQARQVKLDGHESALAGLFAAFNLPRGESHGRVPPGSDWDRAR